MFYTAFSKHWDCDFLVKLWLSQLFFALDNSHVVNAKIVFLLQTFALFWGFEKVSFPDFNAYPA